MRKLLIGLVLLAALMLFAAPADAKKRHGHASRVKGVVLDATCPGACTEPAPPEPPYSGPVTVKVTRASDGAEVAGQATDDGHFTIRLKRGS